MTDVGAEAKTRWPMFRWPFPYGGARVMRALRRLKPIPVDQVVQAWNGVKVRIREDAMYEGLFYLGEYEPWQTKVYQELIRPGDRCLDAGANFGWYTVLFSRWVGEGGQVDAFEPMPDIAALTREAVLLNGNPSNVRITQAGLGNTNGSFVVYRFPGLAHGHASSSNLGRQDAVPVDCVCTTLDSYLEGTSARRCDFVKIDVEGFEREVLLGATETLTSAKPPIIAFEVNVQCLGHRNLRASSVQEVLRNLGYRRFWAIGPRREFFEVQGPLDERVSRDYLTAKGIDEARVEAAKGRLGST